MIVIRLTPSYYPICWCQLCQLSCHHIQVCDTNPGHPRTEKYNTYVFIAWIHYIYTCVCVVWPLLNHAFFSNKNQLIPPALWASAVKGASSSVGGSFCSNPCVELICVSATHLGMNAVWNHQWERTMDVSPIKSSQLPLVRDVNQIQHSSLSWKRKDKLEHFQKFQKHPITMDPKSHPQIWDSLAVLAVPFQAPSQQGPWLAPSPLWTVPANARG